MPQVRTGSNRRLRASPKSGLLPEPLCRLRLYGAGGAPCVTLTGPYNGLNLNAPITVAISRSPKRLYVADLGNNRVLVFTYNGTYVKWWSTAYGGALFQPWGVCVSRRGLVGVASRQSNNTGPPGNVEFFMPNAPSGSQASGDANGVLTADQFCAFDKNGNFFVESTDVGRTEERVPRCRIVNLPGQTLIDSGLGTAAFSVGMYSRINNPANDTLSERQRALQTARRRRS